MKVFTTAAILLGLSSSLGCASPLLTRDGQLVFQQKGAHGAAVITSHGVELIDSNERPPRPIERHSVDEPWRPPTGFLMPRDGVLRTTSKPGAIEGEGLLVLVRSSDEMIPSWGGEVLLRLDAIVPAEAFPAAKESVRPPIDAVLVLDGHRLNAAALAHIAIDDLGGKDRIALADSGRAHAVVPLVPGSNHTLMHAAIDRITAQRARPGDPPRDLAAALNVARGFLSHALGERRVIVLSDGRGCREDAVSVAREAAALRAAGVDVIAIGTPDHIDANALESLGDHVLASASYNERAEAVAQAIPPPGDTVLEDVKLTFDATPAPAHVIEVSDGEWSEGLDRDTIHLGELYAGEARTEIARIAMPSFVVGEPLELRITARYRVPGEPVRHVATYALRGRYEDDFETIAKDRAGDVIAYASALAMVRRLNRAFLGSSADRVGGLRPIVRQQADSLALLGRSSSDAALSAQAAMLDALLGAIDD